MSSILTGWPLLSAVSHLSNTWKITISVAYCNVVEFRSEATCTFVCATLYSYDCLPLDLTSYWMYSHHLSHNYKYQSPDLWLSQATNVCLVCWLCYLSKYAQILFTLFSNAASCLLFCIHSIKTGVPASLSRYDHLYQI